MITVLTVPGLGEPLSLTPPQSPKGMLAFYTSRLSPSEYQLRQFNYHNTYGPLTGDPLSTSYDENLVDAVDTLADAIDKDPNPVVLFGYSGGAQVISILLEEIRAGLRPTLVVLAVVLVANPVRHIDEEPHNLTYGVAGMHGEFPVGIPVINVANPYDIITCSEKNSPIRGISNLTKGFSFTEPNEWIANYIAAAIAGKNQNWWNPFARGAWSRALTGALGYLDGSQHVRWYQQGAVVDIAITEFKNALQKVRN